MAAESLAEVLAARDSEDMSAVVKYEAQHGVVPETPFPEPSAEVEPTLEKLSATRSTSRRDS